MKIAIFILGIAFGLVYGDVVVENQNITLATTGEISSITILSPTSRMIISGPYVFNKAATTEKANLIITYDDCNPKSQSWKGDGKPTVAINLAPRQNLPNPLHFVLTLAPTRKVKDGTSTSIVRTQGSSASEIGKAQWKNGQVEFDLPGEPGLFGILNK